MSKITGIGIALLLVICVPKILSFYDISLSAYGPYLAFLIFIVILAFILPHNFLVTVDTVADVAKNISERSDASATNATSSATNATSSATNATSSATNATSNATNATSNATANSEVGIDVSNKDESIQYTTSSGNSSDKKIT